MIAEILGAVGSAESAKNIVQDLRGLAEQKKFSELVKRIADLDLEMAQTERLLTKAMRESDALDRKNLELEKKNLELEKEVLRLNQELTQGSLSTLTMREDGFYYDGKSSRPYCPTCYADKDKRIPLQDETGHFTVFGKYKCTSCKSHFG